MKWRRLDEYQRPIMVTPAFYKIIGDVMPDQLWCFKVNELIPHYDIDVDPNSTNGTS